MTEEEIISLIALSELEGVGPVMARQLISYSGGIIPVFQAAYKQLIKIPGIGDRTARAVLKKESYHKAQDIYNRTIQAGGTMISYYDDLYPYRLKPLYDAPLLLYFKGTPIDSSKRYIGIVGTRQMTAYGKVITEEIVSELQGTNTVVVSGLAYGVDIAAHKACLKYDVPTIGVMASGLDIIYPDVHEKTAIEMQKLGGILSENILGIKPNAKRLPARNRIIAGLSDALLVIETGQRGGSLISAEFALNYHRDVFAVPGGLNQPMSMGCNKLIQENKAELFTSVKDMFSSMNWLVESVQAPVQRQLIFDGLSGEESQIVTLLKQQESWQIDELSWQSGISPGKLAGILLSLEFQGIAKLLPGKKYQLA